MGSVIISMRMTPNYNIAFSNNSHQQLLDGKECTERCVADIQRWMQANDLKLNQDKTEIMLIPSKVKASNDPPIIQIGDDTIHVSSTANNLGFNFDKYVCCHDQIKQVCKSASPHSTSSGKLLRLEIILLFLQQRVWFVH